MNAVAKRLETADPAEARPAVATPAPAPAPARAAPRPKRRRGRRLLMLALPLALLAGGGYVWLTGGRYVTTDNAYVHQPLVPVSADVPGRIVEVAVAQNQPVQAGDVLFRLDPEPFRIAVDQARAAVDQARLAVAQQRAAWSVAQAQLSAAQEVLEIRQREFDRQQGLQGRGVSTSAALDEARLALRSAEAQVELAKEQIAQAAAALGGDPAAETDGIPSVRAALAAEAAAERALAHTTVTAPAAGIVAQIGNLNVGQYAAAGSMVVSLVETDSTWIEANFKETQIETLRLGQTVDVELDAYPGFHLEGTVESLSSATGSQFSLIPAQNATGNWVKVVQRLPVRIAVAPDAAHPLRDGMSAAVSVDTGASRLDRMR